MNTSQEQIIGKKHQVPPRFELGSLDSESRVLTITPRDLLCFLCQNSTVLNSKSQTSDKDLHFFPS